MRPAVFDRLTVTITRTVARALAPVIRDIYRRLAALEQTAIEQGVRMTSNEARQEALRSRLGEVLGLVKAEFASIKDQLTAAIADKSSAIDARVGQDADRLEQLVGVAESILAADNAEGPAVEVPVVEVPAPGEPAVLPDDSTSGAVDSDQVIAEGPATA